VYQTSLIVLQQTGLGQIPDGVGGGGVGAGGGKLLQHQAPALPLLRYEFHRWATLPQPPTPAGMLVM